MVMSLISTNTTLAVSEVGENKARKRSVSITFRRAATVYPAGSAICPEDNYAYQKDAIIENSRHEYTSGSICHINIIFTQLSKQTWFCCLSLFKGFTTSSYINVQISSIRPLDRPYINKAAIK